jgi:tetrahydromethanopterin S-methyltransferase subunit F
MRYLFIIIASLLSNYAIAQDTPPKDNSPLTFIGLGETIEQNLSGSNGMAGLSATYRDAYHLNILNPASLSSLRSATYELGLFARKSKLDAGTTSNSAKSINLQYLALGFSLKNQINELLDKREKSDWNYGMQLSVTPFTQVGYDVTNTTYNPAIGIVSSAHKGRGGAYRFQWGTGVGYKGFSAGATLGYMFGSITNTYRSVLTSSSNAFQSNFLSTYDLRGIVYNGGLQYDYAFMKKGEKGKMVESGKHIIFGVFGNPSTSFRNYTTTNITRVNTSNTTNGGYAIDTFVNEVGKKNLGTMPGSFSAGIMYEESDKLRVGVNYTSTKWSNYTNAARQSEKLGNASKLALGVEYTPNANSFTSFWNRVRYQAGYFTGKDARIFKNEQIVHSGFTVGMGMPLKLPRNQISFMQVTLEKGKFKHSYLTTDYYQLNLGFTLNDNGWFYKRRFD